MICPCLTLSNIRNLLRVKWSNSGREVARSLHLLCSSYWKRSLLVALDYDRQLYLFYLFACNNIITSKLFTIIIILSCQQHGYSWPSLTTPPYHPSLLAGPQGYIPYLHRPAVCRFKLVTLLLLGCVKGSTWVHHL